MPLVEFCVEGPPISQQASGRSKSAWKKKVVGAAMPELPPNFALTMGPLNVKITYYYEGGALDVDNMQKPILDALEGIVYDDDGCVTDVAGRKRDINGRFRVRGMSPSLARAFAQGSEFVHVVVEIQTDHESL